MLGAPQGEELEALRHGLAQAADAAELILNGQLLQAQAQFNKRPKKEKPPKADPPEESLGDPEVL